MIKIANFCCKCIAKSNVKVEKIKKFKFHRLQRHLFQIKGVRMQVISSHPLGGERGGLILRLLNVLDDNIHFL